MQYHLVSTLEYPKSSSISLEQFRLIQAPKVVPIQPIDQMKRAAQEIFDLIRLTKFDHYTPRYSCTTTSSPSNDMAYFCSLPMQL